jgi:Zn-dependent protease
MIKLGRLVYFPFAVHPLFFLSFGLVYWKAGSTAAVILALSILLHELDHAIVAHRRGMRVHEVSLQPFGGQARWSGYATWRDRFWIAAAGPLVNLGLAAVGYGLLRGGFVRSLELQSAIWTLASWNLGLGLFNLLPVPPLDGWTMVRSLFGGLREGLARVIGW